ncbi:MAG TPA: hypothetical protein VK752_00375 [Bryobacteraceae bacterium]|nr:hypothetical protein [Bryobacteraceae bacterium]
MRTCIRIKTIESEVAAELLKLIQVRRGFMENSLSAANPAERRLTEIPARGDEHSSGVSWGAVIGGAFVAAAISLIMLALGAGFDLSAISPWSNVATSVSAVGTASIVWLIVTQVVACALGGYLAGRLRTKWVAVHTDEVHFRDTANGFLVWAVGLVITVTFLVSSASTMVGNSAPTTERVSVDPRAYFIDRLFRLDTPNPQSVDASSQAEAGRILANNPTTTDQTYLAKLVAAKTGLSQDDARKRVSEITAEVQLAAETARRTASRLLLWIFVALLTGALSASYAATIGGRQRDHVKTI